MIAQMAELVYAPVLGTGSRKGLEVRVLFWARKNFTIKNALVAELVYAHASGACSRKGLGVRVSPKAL